jgi:hypothetical protein
MLSRENTANPGPPADIRAVRIPGVDGLTPATLEAALQKGGRLVFYDYCISFIFLTLRRPSRVYLLRPGETGLVRGLPYALLSLLLGWWGLPWGVIYTPLAIVTDLAGGCDITAEVEARLREAAAASETLPESPAH